MKSEYNHDEHVSIWFKIYLYLYSFLSFPFFPYCVEVLQSAVMEAE